MKRTKNAGGRWSKKGKIHWARMIWSIYSNILSASTCQNKLDIRIPEKNNHVFHHSFQTTLQKKIYGDSLTVLKENRTPERSHHLVILGYAQGIDDIKDVNARTDVIMYTPITIMPSRTNLSMLSFTIPPPIRNAPAAKNPKEFSTWATRIPV